MSEFADPLVSIIIPAYNAEKYIRDAVTSALNQTYRNLEVIIVDDGSDDNTLNILEQEYTVDKRVRILTHPENQNLGVSKTRALGIKASQGEYIAYLDADDIFMPAKIEVQMKIFQDYPLIVLVHGCVEFKHEKNSGAPFYNEFRSFSSDRQYSLLDGPYLEQNNICNSTVMVKKKSISTGLNSFNQLFQYEDWINWILLGGKGDFFYINQPLIVYRYHSHASTYSLVNSNLRPVFAKLEMLFILISRVNERKIKRYIYQELDRQLEIGIRNYGESLSGKSLAPFYLYLIQLRLIRKVKRYIRKIWRITIPQ